MMTEDILRIIPQRNAVPNDNESELDIAIRISSGSRASQQLEIKDRHLNLCVVIDRSGSMNGDKLETAKRGCREIFDRLASEDRFTVVIFDDEAQVVVNPLTARDSITQKIDAITSGGQTNLALGWRLGLLELQTFATDNHIGRLILLSDGEANSGETKVSVLGQESAHARTIGITTSTIGIGQSYQEDILSAIALESGGRFYSVQQTQLEDIINEEFKGSLATRIERPRVSIDMPQGVEISKAFHDLQTTSGRFRIRPILDNDVFSFAFRIRIQPSLIKDKEAVIHAVLYDGEGIVQDIKHPLSIVSPQEYIAYEDNPIVQSIVEEFLALKTEEEVIKKLDSGQFDLMAVMLVNNVGGMVTARDKLHEMQEAEMFIQQTIEISTEISYHNENIRRYHGITLISDLLKRINEIGQDYLLADNVQSFINKFRKYYRFEFHEKLSQRSRRRHEVEPDIMNISEMNYTTLLEDAINLVSELLTALPNDDKLKDLYELFINEMDTTEQ